MNPSTAQGRLVKDLLWDFIVKCSLDTCCKCGKKMSRDTFSIEHLEPWLDSPDPLYYFFNIDNIGYSHLSCNVADNKGPRKYKDKEDSKSNHLRTSREWKASNRKYCPIERRERYKRLGT